MKGFLTFKYDAADWVPSNKYCTRNWAFFDQPSTNFVLYPALKGNCTCGVTIQVAEQYDHPMRNNGERGSMPNARDWYDKKFTNVYLNNWEQADIPYPGGIICYDGWFSSGVNCGGHVQFIYDVDYNNNKILIGESLYQSKKYQYRWISLPKKGDEVFLFNGYRFICQGYLKPYINIDRRVKRDIYKDQVEIKINELRVRNSPGGEIYQGQYFLPGIYDIQEIVEDSNLKWAKLAADIWVGLDERYTEYYPASTEDNWKDKYYLLLSQYNALLDKVNKVKEILE